MCILHERQDQREDKQDEQRHIPGIIRGTLCKVEDEMDQRSGSICDDNGYHPPSDNCRLLIDQRSFPPFNKRSARSIIHHIEMAITCPIFYTALPSKL